MEIKNRSIYAMDDPYAYNTNDLPIECFVDDLPKEVINDKVYYCDQKPKGIRCLIKVAYEPLQTAAQSAATRIGKLFGDCNLKFLQENTILRHNTKEPVNVLFKTQYSEIVSFDYEQNPEIARVLEFNKRGNRTYLPYANLIYCFTNNKEDLSTFQIYVNRIQNESLKAWIEALETNSTLLQYTDKNKREHMKEEMIYSFLFRNFFTDFDFSTKNFGVLYKKDGNVEFSPNFDYGEFFNPVRKLKYPIFNYTYDPVTTDPRIIQSIEESNKRFLEVAEKETPESLAHRAYSDTYNKMNLKFICKHYPHLAYQFMNVIDGMLSNKNAKKFDEIIDSYGSKGVGIIHDDQCDFMKDFTRERLKYFSKLFRAKLTEYVERGYIGKEDDYIISSSAYQPN